jgi:hypothetical protein
MGRGIIDDVATRLVGQMSENLTAQLAPSAPVSADPAPAPAPARPVNGIGLLLAVLRERIRRLLTRGR